MNYYPILILAIGGIILTAGDIIMKKWINTQSNVFYTFGIVVWVIGLLFLAESFKFKNIAVASTIFVIINVVTLLIVNWLYFKEKLSGLETFGIFLGIVAITLLEFGGKK
jgi:multidrug transporter EmrE-like cation transporter